MKYWLTLFPGLTLGLLLSLLLSLASGCVSNAQNTHNTTNPDAILGHWYLFSMPAVAARSPASYQQFTLKIEPSQIHGAAVNHFSSPALIDSNQLSVSSQFTQSKKMAMGEAGKMEKYYFSRLIHAERWQLRGQQLIIDGVKGRLIFQRLP